MRQNLLTALSQAKAIKLMSNFKRNDAHQPCIIHLARYTLLVHMPTNFVAKLLAIVTWQCCGWYENILLLLELFCSIEYNMATF